MIKRAEEKDVRIIAEMAVMLWNSHSVEDMKVEFADIINSEEAEVFLMYVQEHQFRQVCASTALTVPKHKYIQDIPAGFAQCQLRHDYVEGTDSSPVGYLEGIFVKEEYRKRGYGRELLAACEQWAREQGCTEFASDCELNNTGSFHFHVSTGFEEANRVICFTKRL